MAVANNSTTRYLKRSLWFIDLWSVGVDAFIGGGIFTVIRLAVAESRADLFITGVVADTLFL